ncbi:MAG: hypothetical protein ACC628_26075, partial [Pirellulaceae bacterium]
PEQVASIASIVVEKTVGTWARWGGDDRGEKKEELKWEGGRSRSGRVFFARLCIWGLLAKAAGAGPEACAERLIPLQFFFLPTHSPSGMPYFASPFS